MIRYINIYTYIFELSISNINIGYMIWTRFKLQFAQAQRLHSLQCNVLRHACSNKDVSVQI